MSNIIKIIEKGNRLDFEDKYTPVVCGNSNYYLQFSFGEDFSNCKQRVIVFLIDGKKIVKRLVANECKIPPLPNCTSFQIAVFSIENEEKFSTTFLKIRSEPSVFGEISQEDLSIFEKRFDNEKKKWFAVLEKSWKLTTETKKIMLLL